MVVSDAEYSPEMDYQICGFTDFVQEDSKFKQAVRIRNPRKRLKKMWIPAKNKAKCADWMKSMYKVKILKHLSKRVRVIGCKRYSDDPEQVQEPVERKQQLSLERDN
ncbi:DNA-directed RNA polymerase II subunit RPB1-like [Lycium barbarum]|uniref:DNA-directed RNA polymerase II subunit RPB1-like n=1 Tax=Lycium barbarum TaxID=112863 RepID=UPI00293E2390|nr:DNA-directed RNA polymerase II subunit RPB1-like [Lycium barbarum]